MNAKQQQKFIQSLINRCPGITVGRVGELLVIAKQYKQARKAWMRGVK